MDDQEITSANKPDAKEYTRRANRDAALLLAGHRPPEGEDYGHWNPAMRLLLQAFDYAGSWGVQQQLITMLSEGESATWFLLGDAVAPDGRRWSNVLAEMLAEARKAAAERRRAEQKAAAERRMKERLARTTGDSMADEILAMLEEQDLSRTDIYRRYSRNVSAESINDALFVLERLGWARWRMVSTGGRRREVWYLPPEEE